MFYLAVVLESGDVVGGGLDAQNEAEFVVDLDRGFAEAMLDAGPLDPRCELTADLLGELGSDLVAEKGGDVFVFDGEDGLPGKLFIQGFQDGLRAEHQIGGVLDLHETPVVGLGEDVEHWTALLGLAIEDAMQLVGREGLGEGARCQSSMRMKALSAMVKPIPAAVSWQASQLCPLQQNCRRNGHQVGARR